jgi:hypothetical protein
MQFRIRRSWFYEKWFEPFLFILSFYFSEYSGAYISMIRHQASL